MAAPARVLSDVLQTVFKRIIPREPRVAILMTLTITLLTTLSPGTSRSTCYDWDAYFHQVSRLPMSIMDDIDCVGDYAYGAGYLSGLTIVRISDPAAPVTVGQYAVPDARAVQVVGPYAYLVGDFGLLVLDVSNPASPALVGSCSFPGGIDVAVQGGILLAAAWDSGTYIIDVSAPDHPWIIEQITTATLSRGVAFWPEDPAFAYIAESQRLLCIEISDPANPLLIGIVPTTDYLRGMAYADRKVYLLGTDTLYVVDVSHVDAPVLLGSLSGCGGYDAEVRDGIAYIGGGDVYLVDVTNPQKMRLISEVRDEFFEGIGLAGDVMCVGGSSGLRLFDVSNPEVPILGGCPMPTEVMAVAAAGSHAYVGRLDGLSVIDIADPWSPQPIGQLTLSGYIWAIAESENYVFAGSSTGIEIIDITDPTSPSQVGHFEIGPIFDMNLVGDYLYVVEDNGYLYVVNVADPRLPFLAGSVRPGQPGGLHTLAVDFPYVYTTGCVGSFFVINVSIPTDPRVVGMIPGGYYADLTVQGGYVYAADFAVIDVHDPAHPFMAASLPMYGGGIALTDGKAYVETESGLSAIDIEDPLRPALLGATFLNEGGQFIIHQGNILLAAGDSGFVTLPLRCDAADAPVTGFDVVDLMLTANPNPARGTVRLEIVLAAAGITRLDVFDIAGRRIRRILDQGMTAGPHTLLWDGRDEAGRPVATGMYVMRLSSADRRMSTRVALLR